MRGGRYVAAAYIVLLAPACQPAPANHESAPAAPVAHADAVGMSYVGPDKPSLASRVSAADLEDNPQFAIVEIAKVENPRRVPLAFTVAFRPARGPDVTLGTFSLYPPDNPGRFIVATQGKVQPGGQIFVALNDAAAETMKDVRVGISGLSLGAR